MKKKFVWSLLLVSAAGYVYFCWVLLFMLEDQVKESIHKSGSPSNNRKDEVMDRLTNQHCHCKSWASSVKSKSEPASKYRQFLELDSAQGGSTNQCPVQSRLEPTAGNHSSGLINMFDVYRNMHMVYPKYVWTHTGWTDQWQLTYSATQWREEPLQVHVLPFSHNDPGWLSTWNHYYNTKTRFILDEAVSYLRDNQAMTFVWAEIVYLQKWYEEQDAAGKKHFRDLLRTKRFEIVTGGWVMTDEAVAHYPAMLDQLMEGQLWLRDKLNYTVETAWAIDPFGHSATMAYLLQRTGLKNSLVHRTHYAIKKHLGYRQQLQFNWRQAWDKPETPGMFTHMLPFLGYNILYSCGPDIQVCCQLDFSSKKCWAWGEFQEQEGITDENIDDKSWSIVDQLRKKSQLYQHNVILMQHGDDFRYHTYGEFSKQLGNLTKLFNYMNSQPDMRIQIKFSTLSEYFAAVHKSMEKHKKAFPSLVGDFHTYNDRDDQYWSGYFTSRPFLKSRTRLLQSQLRAVEILYTLSLVSNTKLTTTPPVELEELLTAARRASGLLQHHDAITGTARAKVVRDYLKILHEALEGVQTILKTCVSVLLQGEPAAEDTFTLLEMPESQSSLSELQLIELGDGTDQTVVVYNPLPVARHEAVTVLVSSAYMKVVVVDNEGNNVRCQINPSLSGTTIAQDKFRLVFLVSVPALSISKFLIKPAFSAQGSPCPLASVTMHSSVHDHSMRSVFRVTWEGKADFTIGYAQLGASFCSCTGLLQGIQNRTSGTYQDVQMQFVTYSTGHWNNPLKDKSGAYVFIPDGSAKDYVYERYISVQVEGPLMSSVTTYLPLVAQEITLYNISGPGGRSLRIENLVNIQDQSNLELAMRMTTVDNTGPYFYTDLNGFQVHRRETMSKHGIQGNFYPMTSLAFLDNGRQRLSLHSAQSHGVASLLPGELEVMLDRRLDQDDWRGLDEGVEDNIPTVSKFVLLLESRKYPVKSFQEEEIGLPSLLSHHLSDSLNNPVILLHQAKNTPHQNTQLLSAPWPCDLRLLNLRSVRKRGGMVTALLVVHRLGVSCDIPASQHCDNDLLAWQNLFSNTDTVNMEEMNLSGVQSRGKITESSVSVSPMEIKTYKVTLTTQR